MSRLEQMTEDIENLARYFDSDRIFGIRRNKDGIFEVDMYADGFFRKFNCWEKRESEYTEDYYILSRPKGKVIYNCFIKKSEYQRMWESEEDF